jgi:hypothetical protein
MQKASGAYIKKKWGQHLVPAWRCVRRMRREKKHLSGPGRKLGMGHVESEAGRSWSGFHGNEKLRVESWMKIEDQNRS